LSSGEKREPDEQKKNPPLDRGRRLKAKDAYDFAMDVQKQVMQRLGAEIPDKLETDALPNALAGRVTGFAKQFQQLGWNGPAQQLQKMADLPTDEKGRDRMNRFVSLFAQLSTLAAIESELKAINKLSESVNEPNDPILKQFRAFVQRKVNAEVGSNADTKEIADRLAAVRTKFEKSEFWPQFFAFVNGTLKNEVNRQELAATNIYDRFRKTSPQLQDVDLENWLDEAKKYVIPKVENPAKAAGFTQLAATVGTRFEDLKARHAAKKEPTPQEIVDAYKQWDATVVALQSMTWRSGTRDDIKRGVQDAEEGLKKLDVVIGQAIAATERTPLTNVLNLTKALKTRTFTSNAATERWEKLKRNWSLDNIDKLQTELQKPKDFDQFKDRALAAENNLRLAEKALAQRLDLSGVSRNSDWNRALGDVLKRMDDRTQDQYLRAAVGVLNEQQITTATPMLQVELDKLHQQYEEWKKEARELVASANLLEDHLDAGYGLSEEKSQVANLYGKLMESSFCKNADVLSALAPLSGRRRELDALGKENSAAALAEKASKSLDPSLVVDAWQRLNRAEMNWPVTAADLELYRQLRKRPAAVIANRTKSQQSAELARPHEDALNKELDQQAAAAWRRFMVARRTVAEVDLVLQKALDVDLIKEFGIDLSKVEPTLPAAVRFNIFLLNNKRLVNDLPEKLDDKKAQVAVASLLGDLTAGNDASLERIRNGLAELAKDPGGGDGGDVVDAGPASKKASIQWVRGGTPEKPTFTWSGHTLTFVRLEGNKLAPYYLCTSEISLGLFAALMHGLKAGDLNLPKGDGLMNGPQLWERTGEDSLRARPNWMRSHSQTFSDFAPGLAEGGKRLAQADANPLDTMPMQNVPPEAALLIAELIGCRLPTSAEWELALGRYPPSPKALPNLRDAAWYEQLKHITAVRGGGALQAQFPEVGMFTYQGEFGTKEMANAWMAKWTQQFHLDVPGGFNDAYVYLRPVGNGTTVSDLIGNVAEMVFDAPAKLAKVEAKVPKLQEVLAANQDQLFVIGGSCMSPPEIGFAKQPCGMHGGFADVGFRVAFEAANRLIVDRLKELMSEQNYVAVGGN